MKKFSHSIQNIVYYLFFATYVIVLLLLLIFKYVAIWDLFDTSRRVVRSVNIIPFHSISSYLFSNNLVLQSFAFSNVFGNIILFVPLGIYLCMFTQNRKPYINALWALLISVLVEVAQFIFGLGVSDIDDVLLNGFGGLIGVVVYQILLAIFTDSSKVRIFVTVCAAIVGMPILVILGFGLLRFQF